jgi:DNA-binding transcriptional ArsR family regulator
MAFPGEDSITLDRKAFKALASETRVEILKRLDGTQMTVSDLARDMDMNKATMFEHLEQLVEVGLVRKDTEEDRATTVKTVGLDAPVQGPPKKWVYYRLTWKGKNVLHPERVKIAIMLSSIALALAIAGLLYIAYFSPTPGPGPSAGDTSPPLVIGWDTDAVRPGSAVDVSITVADNRSGKVSGIDVGGYRIAWGIASSSGSVVPDRLNWSMLGSIQISGQGTMTLSGSVPARDWTPYNGTYLLVGVLLVDNAGNSAWYYRSVPIHLAALPELRFVSGSPKAMVTGSGYDRMVTISAVIENVGTANSSAVLVGLYQYDPDPDHHGSTTTAPLAQAFIGAVPSGGSVSVHLQLSSKYIRARLAYLMVDTNGSMPEMDKSDNVISFNLPGDAVHPAPAASAGAAPGFELVATAVAVLLSMVLVRRLRNLRG